MCRGGEGLCIQNSKYARFYRDLLVSGISPNHNLGEGEVSPNPSYIHVRSNGLRFL